MAAHCGRMGASLFTSFSSTPDAPEHTVHVPLLDAETLKTHAVQSEPRGVRGPPRRGVTGWPREV